MPSSLAKSVTRGSKTGLEMGKQMGEMMEPISLGVLVLFLTFLAEEHLTQSAEACASYASSGRQQKERYAAAILALCYWFSRMLCPAVGVAAGATFGLGRGVYSFFHHPHNETEDCDQDKEFVVLDEVVTSPTPPPSITEKSKSP